MAISFAQTWNGGVAGRLAGRSEKRGILPADLPQTGSHAEGGMRKQARPMKTQAKARTPRPEFTPEELALLDRLITETPKTKLGPLWKHLHSSGAMQGEKRGRQIDPRLHAAWNDWEMASSGKKPSYRSLALRYFGRADCLACGGKETISFGTFNIKRAEWWLRQDRRTGDCYCCNRCKTPYLLSDAQTGRICCDLPKDFPAPVPDTALTLSKPDSNHHKLSLKKAIPRLHRQLQERTKRVI